LFARRASDLALPDPKVNYILTQPHGKRIAVIENEFGAVNIDEDLVSENLR
jgi:G3E family GTPase